MRTIRLILLLVAFTMIAGATIAAAQHGGRPLTATLLGSNEAPGPGDPNGTGEATVTVNPGQGEVCYEISVEDVALPATGAHIHVAPAGTPGPVVVPLNPPDASGQSSGCAAVDRELALAILRNPENYYVNVHTTEYPAGAVRGQLER